MHIALVAVYLSLLINTSLSLTGGQALCSNGDVRLVGGHDSLQLSGRLEICFNNQWGSVCATTQQPWTQNNAAVVCKQLGHSDTGAIVPGNGYFGVGYDAIHLSNVNCNGNEDLLTNCATSLIGQYNCTHEDDVAVVCQDKSFSCEDGEVRLTDGDSINDGRIEVCYNNQYGTICDDYWDSNDANVVCRQLGFSGEGAIALHKAAFGPGYGPLYLDDLKCDGDEPRISRCGHNGVSDSNCQHSEDAGVICKPYNALCNDGDVRLVNGNTANEGRVEVCYNGVWGTVCHDLWDDNDAAVVCSQLGYTVTGAKAVKFADFGEGNGVIFLDSVKCLGTEKFLNECISDPLAVHNCGHNKDAGVICEDPASKCINGDVQLTNNTQANAGRVEICYNNHYGTVCEDDWTTEDANVVCGQLGYEKYGAIAVKSGYYGNGVGMIYLDNLKCIGEESDLFKCKHNGIGVTNCYHNQDAAVICKEKVPIEASCTNGDVKLVGGTISSEGYVQVCINGVWSSICAEGWDTSDAEVVCNQLQFPNSEKAIAVPGGHYVPHGDVLTLFSNVSCTGTESNIFSCDNTDIQYIGSSKCSSSNQIAGVICSAPNPDCQNGDVRLVGGITSNQGLVEICYNGIWGTMCGNDDWRQQETAAAVICHQLGHNLKTTRPVPVASGSFGTGMGITFLSNVHCYGNENSLTECIGANFGYQSCPRTMDMAVVCAAYPCVDGEYRLVGNEDHGTNEGRLEVCHNGVWKIVCANEISTAHVQQLCTNIVGPNMQGSYGLPGLFAGVTKQVNGAISGSCGSSNNIQQCLTQSFTDDFTTCGRHNSIGIICSSIDTCTSGDVRLVGGANPYEGRVEVCLGSEWGTVCDDSWDDKSASVVCNQLEYSTTDAVVTAIPGGYYGNSEVGDILLDNVRCTGTEANLLQCLSVGIKNHNCHRKEHAGVRCRDTQESTTSSTTTITNTANNIEPTETNVVGLNIEGDEMTISSCVNGLNNTVFISIGAMVTVIVLLICLTIFAILVYKRRKFSIENEKLPPSINSRYSSQTLGSPMPSDIV